jgi:hypothetical protein
LFKKNQKDEVSDTTGDAIKTKAGNKKINSKTKLKVIYIFKTVKTVHAKKKTY